MKAFHLFVYQPDRGTWSADLRVEAMGKDQDESYKEKRCGAAKRPPFGGKERSASRNQKNATRENWQESPSAQELDYGLHMG